MRFTEHELTVALTGAAKRLLAAQRRDIRRGKVDVDTAWEQTGRYQRYTMLTGLGDQVLPLLAALPEVEVEPGTRPTFTDAQIIGVVEERIGQGGGRMRRKIEFAATVGLLRAALAHLPPRIDPEGLTIPDHL